MIRHGTAPFLECSSRGDKRFSAYFAQVHGKSIERRYQEFKEFEDGVDLTWRERGGLEPLNKEACHELYSVLWDEYIRANEHLLGVIRAASGLSDMYGKAGHACQATELWRIRNDYKTYPDRS